MLKYFSSMTIALLICLDFFLPNTAKAIICTEQSNCSETSTLQGPICVGKIHTVVYAQCPHFSIPGECSCGCIQDDDCKHLKGVTKSGPKCVASAQLGVPHCGCYKNTDCGLNQYCSWSPGSDFFTCMPKSQKPLPKSPKKKSKKTKN